MSDTHHLPHLPSRAHHQNDSTGSISVNELEDKISPVDNMSLFSPPSSAHYITEKVRANASVESIRPSWTSYQRAHFRSQSEDIRRQYVPANLYFRSSVSSLSSNASETTIITANDLQKTVEPPKSHNRVHFRGNSQSLDIDTPTPSQPSPTRTRPKQKVETISSAPEKSQNVFNPFKWSIMRKSASAIMATPNGGGDWKPTSVQVKNMFMTHYQPFASSRSANAAGDIDNSPSVDSLRISGSNMALDEEAQMSADVVDPAEEMDGKSILESLLVKGNLVEKSETEHSLARTTKSETFKRRARVFDFFAIVKLVEGEPAVSYQYPLEVDKQMEETIVRNVALFSFPEVASQSEMAVDYNSRETFDFVLSQGIGKKRHGYCKRVPLGDGNVVVLSIISCLGCYPLYHDILDAIEVISKEEDKLTSFLEHLRMLRIPKAGMPITVLFNSTAFTFHRPVESASFNDDQSRVLLACFGITDYKSLTSTAIHFMKLVCLLNALLLERRVIFFSKSLRKLSDCCTAASKMLYPLEWQHIFIPILPRKLIEFVNSPTPYIMGVLASDMPRIMSCAGRGGNTILNSITQEFSLERTFVFDLDTSRIVMNDMDVRDQIIPPYLLACLKGYIEPCFPTKLGDDPLITIQDGFLSFFTLLFGAYRQHMEVEVGMLPHAPHILMETSTGKKSEEFLRGADRVRVWFDFKNFVENHSLVTGIVGDNLRIPSTKQRLVIKQYLQQLDQSQNFNFFIQEREEALEYHYQLQIDRAQGRETTSPWNNISKNNVSSGMKNYFALSESKFEKRVTLMESSRRKSG